MEHKTNQRYTTNTHLRRAPRSRQEVSFIISSVVIGILFALALIGVWTGKLTPKADNPGLIKNSSFKIGGATINYHYVYKNSSVAGTNTSNSIALTYLQSIRAVFPIDGLTNYAYNGKTQPKANAIASLSGTLAVYSHADDPSHTKPIVSNVKWTSTTVDADTSVPANSLREVYVDGNQLLPLESANGPFDFVFKPTNYLPVYINNVTAATIRNTLHLSMAHPGDFNNNGQVDSSDIEALRPRYGEKVVSGQANAYDVNADGYVDDLDYSLVSNAYGKNVAQVAPPTIAGKGGSFTLAPDKTSVRIGDTVTYTLKVASADPVSTVRYQINYDPAVLTNPKILHDSTFPSRVSVGCATTPNETNGDACSIDATKGTISQTRTHLGGSVTGTNEVVQIQFTAKAVSSSANVSLAAAPFTRASVDGQVVVNGTALNAASVSIAKNTRIVTGAFHVLGAGSKKAALSGSMQIYNPANPAARTRVAWQATGTGADQTYDHDFQSLFESTLATTLGSGPYDVVIKPDYYLATSKQQSALAGGARVTFGNVVPGDFNNDNTIGIGDLGMMAAAIGHTPTDSYARYDLNGDGAIDTGDIGIFAAHYGQSGSADWSAN